MKVTTAAQMQEIDRYTINEIGIPGIVLMENAGLGVVRSISKHFPDAHKIAVLCGKGNNGGDGFVVARHLFNLGKDIFVLIIGDMNKIKGDAKVNLDIIKKMGLNIKELKKDEEIAKNRMKLLHSNLIVDAMFGTGLDSAVKGIYAKVIEMINDCEIPVVSVDLPSGLCVDHGRILGSVVRADCTVTFGLPKRCLYLFPAADFVGDLDVVDISFPINLEIIENIEVEYISEDIDLSSCLPLRARDSHKGTFGHIFILGGSPGKTGAPIMAAEGALRCGAGLVTCGVPESLNPIFETQLKEAMTLPLSETEEKTLHLNCDIDIKSFINERTISSLAIGPGISLNPGTQKLVLKLIKESVLPTVIDADALNSLTGENLDFLTENDAGCRILTPHPGEMARLIKKDVKYVQENPISVAQEFAQKYNLILALKGAPTITASPDGRTFINSTGNPGLASGGSGDVLTGMIATLVCQVQDPLWATIIAVYIHGLAADLCSVDIGEVSMIASDVIEYIPEALALL